ADHPPARLPSDGRRRVHESPPAGVFPPEAAALAARPVARGGGHPGEPFRWRHLGGRPDRPGERRDRPRPRAPHPRPGAQAHLQDRPGAGADRERHLRLLRGERGADRPPPPRGAADRHPLDRGAGAPRADGAGPPRRL
ncbi:MAG: DksA family protein PA5536 (no Zn-finger), partial [uncultured Craurococcus sp.]